ncbi:MAG: 1-deoxy-D-xylulose-5-phosphate synthase [candidate division Zixibacteria bacterium]|nr:1-deoxy-D-xylulose-5-phosphate synthase [candidate division Zixibacteria bacterium]
MSLLKSLKSPSELHDFTDEQLVQFADEVREHLLDSVSQTGGHFASNLGVVELTVALHAVFDTPKDKLIWDVSHQIYPHKIITGRADRMTTIRTRHGLSGFSAPTESEYDVFLAAHASTSISAAMGFACARDARGEDYKVVTITGDGAMTGGLCYEGLNHLGGSKKDVLIILNDNRWAISRTVGALSRYLTNIMTDERYNKLRKEVWELTGRFKRREKIRATVRRLEHSFKALVSPGSLFEDLGLRYFGPIDGNNLPLLRKTLTELKSIGGPRVLHILTKKGAGYPLAESDALKYYAVTPFDRATGKVHPKPKTNPAYTKVFGDALVELGGRNELLNVITAAMPTGSGVIDFGEKFPERFHDVGIAEEHATCFAAGMAAGGVRPLLVIYSTFMQRGYDQMIHDIALQNLPVVVCMDRAGLVGADGPTHHGTFDISYMQTIPNVTICVPKDGNELRSMLRYAVEEEITGPITMRYPRGPVPDTINEGFAPIEWGKWEILREGETVCVLACGTMVGNSLRAADIALKETGRNITVVNARFIKPLDEEMLLRLANTYSVIMTVEENALMGGFGSTVSRRMHELDFHGRVINLGLPDKFIPHGSIEGLWEEIGLDSKSIAARITEALTNGKAERKGFFKRLTFKRQSEKQHKDSASGAPGATAAEDLASVTTDS